MAAKLKQMRGEELIKKILAGERNFSGIKLEVGTSLSTCEGFADLNNYLREQGLQGLRENPVIIRGSSFKYVEARGLFLPYVIGEGAYFCGADFGRANLEGAYLGGADFCVANLGGAYLRRAYLGGADFCVANLEGANLGGAYLGGADFWGANLEGADFWGANLERANLGGAKKLEYAINLGHALLYKTKVGPKEKRIIEEELKNAQMQRFVVE